MHCVLLLREEDFNSGLERCQQFFSNKSLIVQQNWLALGAGWNTLL